MNKNLKLTIAIALLIVLGITMIYIGGFYGPKVILPPILTGIGFFVLAWAIQALKQ